VSVSFPRFQQVEYGNQFDPVRTFSPDLKVDKKIKAGSPIKRNGPAFYGLISLNILSKIQPEFTIQIRSSEVRQGSEMITLFLSLERNGVFLGGHIKLSSQIRI
jgi:hypothetical protein